MDSVAAASFENHIWKFCTLEATSLVKRVCNFTPSFRKKWQQSSRARSSEQANDVSVWEPGLVLFSASMMTRQQLLRCRIILESRTSLAGLILVFLPTWAGIHERATNQNNVGKHGPAELLAIHSAMGINRS
ncbi:hypothetical protein Y032_0093g2624 [Ancylostoma ceylanicum]|uniref:Uncharacterized protein n=1 Tax=Ancylostoma ceylanicum TaxID=53326 RepID=A0A016TLC8_9BILA|nr:hypothetical protein Y032_0093g2624 [Ancylostoma ceylanicum]